jgi:mono/diheme cytochrome c family protein
LLSISRYNRRLFESFSELTMRLPANKFGLITLILATGLVARSQLAAAGGDAEAGKVKSITCIGCHGIPGYNNVYPTYKVPKLGGQNYGYLVSALKAYRAGERNHATMQLQAQPFRAGHDGRVRLLRRLRQWLTPHENDGFNTLFIIIGSLALPLTQPGICRRNGKGRDL